MRIFISAPIIMSQDSTLFVMVTYDANGMALGAFVGQQREKILYPIYSARKPLNLAQKKYFMTEKELLAVVFVFEKFWS